MSPVSRWSSGAPFAGGTALAAERVFHATRSDAFPPMKILVLDAGAIAVGDAHGYWLLLCAARAIAPHEALADAARDGRLAGVVLLDAQLDDTGGLAALCRTHPLALYATPGVFEELTARLPRLALPPLGVALRWHPLPVAGDRRHAEFGIDGMASLRGIAIDDGGCAAPWSPLRREAVVGDSLALRLEDRDSGQCLVYAPGRIVHVLDWIDGADCVLVGEAEDMLDDEADAVPRVAGLAVAQAGLEITL